MQICNYHGSSLSYLEKTEKLYICCCPYLEIVSCIPYVTELYFTNCPLLKSIDLSKFSNLKKLYFDRCEKLTTIRMSRQLKTLQLYNLRNLTEIPDISYLEKITINGCGSVSNIDDEYIAKRYIAAIRINRWSNRMCFLISKRFKILQRISEYYSTKASQATSE